MQVRAKTAETVNYDGQILDLDPAVTYDGPFATWLHATGADVEIIEGEPATGEPTPENVKPPTVAELRQTAADLGIEGADKLKKAALLTAIEAHGSAVLTAAEPVEGEPATGEPTPENVSE